MTPHEPSSPAPAAAYEFRNLRLGEVLDHAAKILLRRFWLFAAIVMIIEFPVELINGIMVYEFPIADDLIDEDELYEIAEGNESIRKPWNLAYKALMFFALYPLGAAATVRVASRELLGTSVTLGAALRFGASKIMPLVATNIRKWLLIMVGLILLIVPGVYLFLRYFLTDCVVTLEGRHGTDALRRSKDLMECKGAKRAAIVMTILYFGFALSSGVALVLLQEVIPFPYLAIVMEATLVASFTAVVSAATTAFYMSLRSRLEHFDLEILASRVAEGAPGAETGTGATTNIADPASEKIALDSQTEADSVREET